jgi:hypothetical protein
MEAHLTINVEGVNRFITTPEHQGSVAGFIICERLGGRLPVSRGTFNIFVDAGDPARKKVLYRIFFDDAEGRTLTLSGFKDLSDDPGMDFLNDTSTIFAKLYSGAVTHDEESASEVVAAGILRVSMIAFLKHLLTFHTEGPTLADRTSALTRFGLFYFGRLWDVYARRLLSSGPV